MSPDSRALMNEMLDQHEAMAAIIETIMTQHWDLAACSCWVCTQGRAAGLHPREEYLAHRHPETRRPVVMVDICFCHNIKYPTQYVHTDDCPLKVKVTS